MQAHKEQLATSLRVKTSETWAKVTKMLSGEYFIILFERPLFPIREALSLPVSPGVMHARRPEDNFPSCPFSFADEGFPCGGGSKKTGQVCFKTTCTADETVALTEIVTLF